MGNLPHNSNITFVHHNIHPLRYLRGQHFRW